MYVDQIKTLLNAALVDGVVTERERQILIKKAESMGITPDEFEMMLDARLIELEKARKEEAERAEKLDELTEGLKSAGLGILRGGAGIAKNFGVIGQVAGSVIELGLDQVDSLLQPQEEATTSAATLAPSQPTPPPMPGAVSYMLAVNGQQYGPYNMQQMQQMALQGQLTTQSLVWCQGMVAWEPASNRPDLAMLFAPAIPPVPPMPPMPQ